MRVVYARHIKYTRIEVTMSSVPSIPKREYARRRKAYADLTADGITILQSRPQAMRNGDVEYPYRQDSDFLYLTGFPEDDSVAVIRQGKKPFYVLFVRPKNRKEEIWTGARIGEAAAKKRFGADAVYPIGELVKRLSGLLRGMRTVYYDCRYHDDLAKTISRSLHRITRKNPSPAIASLRMIKSKSEVRMLDYAVRVSAVAHAAAARTIRPGVSERTVAARIEYEMRRRNAEPGYGIIVGAGRNALILHYVDCEDTIAKGDLVLVDAGAEYGGYTADVTRTYPASGRFTDAQRIIYSIVLDANKRAIDAVKRGVSPKELDTIARKAIVEGLIQKGIVRGRAEDLLKKESSPDTMDIFPHGVGHSLGIDVHDPGLRTSKKKLRTLEPGMVITIEPGIYLRPRKDMPKRFHNIGIRIEDDVLVTAKGHRVLTSTIPKEIKDVERIMCRNRQ